MVFGARGSLMSWGQWVRMEATEGSFENQAGAPCLRLLEDHHPVSLWSFDANLGTSCPFQTHLDVHYFFLTSPHL